MKMEKVKKAYASSSNDIFSPALIIKFHQSISRTKRKRMFQWQFSNAYFPLERVFFFMFGFMFPISKFIFQLTRSLNDFSQFLSCQRSAGDPFKSIHCLIFTLRNNFNLFSCPTLCMNNFQKPEEEVKAYWDSAPRRVSQASIVIN